MLIDKKRKIENELDFDFRAEMNIIDTLDDFDEFLMKPYKSGERIYYRGERRNSITRPLIPTIYRKREMLFNSNQKVELVTAEKLYEYYDRTTDFFKLYERIIGRLKTDEMYPFLAFSQHYFGISPLIDFSKSLYVSLSFALKDRTEFDDNILIYTLQLKDNDDYTDSIEVANRWINEYSVLLFRDIDKVILQNHYENPFEVIADYKKIADKFKGYSFLDMNAPTAKLIDVPANDLIKYQQGVFLLLDDFSLFGKSYLTKKIRDDFHLKKWIINKDICPDILDMLVNEEPYYQYKYITNLSSIVEEIKKKSGF